MTCGVPSQAYGWYVSSEGNITGPGASVSDITYTFIKATACQSIRQISISVHSSDQTVQVVVQARDLKTYYSIVDAGLRYSDECGEKGYYFNSHPPFTIDENGFGALKFVEDAVGDENAFEDRPLFHTFSPMEKARNVEEALTLLSKVDTSVMEINNIMQKVFSPQEQLATL